MIVVAAVLGVVTVGTAGYWLIEAEQNISFFDALYMTVITISTVGHEAVWNLSRAGQVWTIGVIAFEIVTVSYAFTSLVTLVISGELRSMRVRRKMDKAIEQSSSHVIVCGFGGMGRMVTAELRARDVSVVIIEIDAALEPKLRTADVTYIVGDATDETTLLGAGLMRAKALVTALPSDADNVYTALTARTLHPDLLVVARAEQPTTEAKLLRAGATRVVCPQVIGATKIANLLTRPNVVDFIEVADKGVDLGIDEFVISPRSPVVGKTLSQTELRARTGATVVAIKRADGEALISPGADTRLAEHDTVILVGPAGMSSRLTDLELPE